MKEDLLSVIVPVYNSEESLEHCIESVLDQSYSDLEVILVDDGSRDSSSQLCDQFQIKDDRIHVYHKDNAGVSSARNYGLTKAQGRFLAFLDSDDYVDINYYEKMISLLIDKNVQMVISNWTAHKEGHTEVVDIGGERLLSATELTDIIAANDYFCGGGFPWNRVIDRNCFPLQGSIPFINDLDVYEDKIWLLENLKFMKSIYITEFPGYHYVINSESLSRCDETILLEGTFAAWSVIKNFYNNDLPDNVADFEALKYIIGFWALRKKGNKEFIRRYWPQYKRIVRNRLSLKKPKNIVKYILIDIYA